MINARSYLCQVTHFLQGLMLCLDHRLKLSRTDAVRERWLRWITYYTKSTAVKSSGSRKGCRWRIHLSLKRPSAKEPLWEQWAVRKASWSSNNYWTLSAQTTESCDKRYFGCQIYKPCSLISCLRLSAWERLSMTQRESLWDSVSLYPLIAWTVTSS